LSDMLYKANSIVIKGDDKRVIDSNHIVSERIRMLSEILENQSFDNYSEEFVDGFVEGLDASQVEQLLDDSAVFAEEDFVREVPQVDTQKIIDEANEQAELIIADANARAQEIIDSATAQSQNIKADAANEGREQGYNDGYNEAMAKGQEIEEQLAQRSDLMDADYARRIEELEPYFVETLTDIYSHVLGIDLKGQSRVVLYLLKDAIRNIDGARNFLVHVSKDDFQAVSQAREELMAGLGNNVTMEIIEDMTLGSSECFIEAESGIFDCGLGTELELLKKELILLSYQKEK